MNQRIEVQRRDLTRTRLVVDPDAERALGDGQVRLGIRRFALTANNVTYAAFGELMKYWQFFPADGAAWGCVPVWGFAEVVESRADDIAVGERLYGYLPMGTHLVVQAVQANRTGFSDGSAHRAELPAIYNRLQRCAQDASWRPDNEGVQAVLRPLFTTAFLIDDFLADAAWFGARQIVLSSASSKTAWCTAYCLALRRGMPGTPEIVGLTSPGHHEFVRSLGCFDRVLDYAEVEALDATAPSVYVDFAGDAALRGRVHHHWADSLRHSAAVGGTHWQDLGPGQHLPGPRPTLFFAPAQAARRAAPPPDGWGPAGLGQRIEAGWASLMQTLAEPQQPWLRIEECIGLDACRAGWLALLAGSTNPRAGLVCTL